MNGEVLSCSPSDDTVDEENPSGASVIQMPISNSAVPRIESDDPRSPNALDSTPGKTSDVWD